MKRGRGLAVLASAVPLLLACGGVTEPACVSAVILAVTSSTTPTFSWTPNCLVAQLQVYESVSPSAGGDIPVWTIEARSAGAGAAGPVVYGRVPLVMRATTGPAALVVGHSYVVVLVSAAGAEIGRRVFGP